MRFETLPSTGHPGVVLRPLEPRDLPEWAGYLNDVRVYEHTSWNHPTAEELASYLGCHADRSPAGRLRLAVARRDDGRLVGTAGFHSVSPENRVAELAYDLHPDVWGRGIATAVAGSLVAWAHDEAAVIRVQATALVSNLRSRRVLAAVGFVQEGVLRSYRMVRGRPGDFALYAHVR